ncbi:hypothetical protein C3B47_06320 [Flavobacterium columnare]|uniref:O-antigen ligase family protein n=1 Tax=Flavobacterium columnare TaxID=996 RepID=UPI000D19B5B6|nr:O-antigen ligase family protein [Flavobacterium columnare]MBF6652508.1 hypothetical protein [Flavobacterium columnare]MBF6655522.1 hypothetical protein [Flavobacterium columnare]MBF6658377.1 hypothetical protein [Flavobacterium columnare]PTD14817.1 hypothetical protein C6N29_10395 [Flavobacterium columnare]
MRNPSKYIIVNASVLGAILSMTITELRFNSFVGVPELLMVLAIFFFLISLFKKKPSNVRAKIPSNFLIGFFVLNLVGFFYAMIFVEDLRNYDLFYEGAIRTFFAYMLAVLNCVALFLTIEKSEIIYVLKRILFYFNLTYIFTIATLFPLFLFSISNGERFFGYALNPNQHGTLLVGIPFLTIYLYQNKFIKRIFFLITIFISVVIAYAIISDAVFYSVILTMFLYFVLYLKKIDIQIKILLFVFFLLICNFYLVEVLVKYVDETNSNADQANVRFTLWMNGVQAFLDSPLVGFGPGSFSGDFHPFEWTECHNTFIDLLTNVGIIGVFIYLVLILRITVKLYFKMNYLPILILISLIIFSFFHNVLRHPTFWMLLLTVYYISSFDFKNKTN